MDRPRHSSPPGSPAHAAMKHDIHAATRRLARPRELTFPTVEHALRWAYASGKRMQAPHSSRIRTEELPDGTSARVCVDGGRGGDVDEVLATQATITKALARLREHNEMWWICVAETYGVGRSQAEIGRMRNIPQQQVSRNIGLGEAYLAAILVDVLS